MKKLWAKILVGVVLVSMVALGIVIPASATAAPTFPTLAGTYTVSCNIGSTQLNGTRNIAVRNGTLTITTVTSVGVVSSASLTLANMGTVALTGFVGTGTTPKLSLVGSDGTTVVTIKANVNLHRGLETVQSITGNISGFIKNQDGTLAADNPSFGATTISTTEQHSGTNSVKLAHLAAEGSIHAEFAITNGIRLSQLGSLTANSGYGYWFWLASGKNMPAQIELRFQNPTLIGQGSPDGAGHVDITVIPTTYPVAGTDAWVQYQVLGATSKCIYYGNNSWDGSAIMAVNLSAMTTLNAVLASINAQANMTAHTETANNWRLTRVRIETYENNARDCYVDDVQIARTTYTFDPVAFIGNFSAK